MDKALTIGTVARRAGVRVDTVRFYEKRGILPKPERTESGYRTYDDETVRVLRFVRRAQELGFTLREVQQLLELQGRPELPCAEVRKRAAEKVADIDRRVKDLLAMREALAVLVDACPGSDDSTYCPILEALRAEDAER
jgi:Hg(II)-responsive transcriptional regulator